LTRILKLTFKLTLFEADPLVEIGAADAWANVVPRLQSLRGANDPGMLGPYEAVFATPSGRVRVRLPAVHRVLPGDGLFSLFAAPAGPAIVIHYVRSLRFRQYDTARQRLQQLVPP
jgi:hypothetical protein